MNEHLSLEQQSALESAYLLIRTARPLLDLLCAKPLLNDVDRMQLQCVIRLFVLNEHRLAAYFPEVRTIEQKLDAQDGR